LQADNQILQRGAALTPVAFVNAILLGYAKYAVDPTGMLARAGIAPELLTRPGARVTGRQFELVSEIAMRELDDEALGWFSRRMHWGTFAMLFRASLTAPDLGLALKRWFRHHRLLIDDIELSLSVERDVASVTLIEHAKLGATRQFCLLSYLRYVHGYACWALDSQIHLLGVRLPHSRPADAEVYPVVFAHPVEFDAPAAGFSFDTSYLALPQMRDDAALRQLMKRPLPLSLRPYRRDRLMLNRVRKLLQADLQRYGTAQAVADHLNISTRTLHRQFEDGGVSFHRLKDEVRHAVALDLLRRTEKPLKQIATLAGFSSEKSFIRAFSKWSGKTPGELRQSASHAASRVASPDSGAATG